MTGKYLLGAASTALCVVAFSSAAKAADVMPIVVPVVAPVAVPPVGPAFEINIETWFETDVLDPPADPLVLSEASVRLTTASGWGFELITSLFTYVLPPPGRSAEVTGRVFRSAGSVEVGAYAGAGVSVPFGPGYRLGGDFEYDTERLTLEGYVEANFAAAGFEFLETAANLTVHVSDKLDIGGGIALETGPVEVAGFIGLQYDLGLLAPYAQVWFGNDRAIDLGVELEHRFGEGPISLLGYAEVELDGTGPEVFLGIGVRFNRGGTD